MKKQIIEHSASIIFVILVFSILFYLLTEEKQKDQKIVRPALPSEFKIDSLDLNNPLHNALLRESLSIFYNREKADSIYQLYELENLYKSNLNKTPAHSEISKTKIVQMLLMFLKFVFVYILVLFLTYYGVETIAILRFVNKKQNKPPYLIRAYHCLNRIKKGTPIDKIFSMVLQSLFYILKAIVKIILYLILFSPAYVIAYSFKTRFDTDSIIFMIALGVISNALLVTYAQKFYTFLISESNKGYVETAIVKNLNNDYSTKSIPLFSIFQFKKYYKNHVFNHIFINAKYQYFSTIKEQAAFLISGLIIIEMALNIHGHLGYDLMQNLLYQNYRLVLIAVLLIYIAVKLTEIFVDVFIFKANKKYQN